MKRPLQVLLGHRMGYMGGILGNRFCTIGAINVTSLLLIHHGILTLWVYSRTTFRYNAHRQYTLRPNAVLDLITAIRSPSLASPFDISNPSVCALHKLAEIFKTSPLQQITTPSLYQSYATPFPLSQIINPRKNIQHLFPFPKLRRC